MTEPSHQDPTPEVPASQRWQARLTDPEHLPQLTGALSLLPGRELAACCRTFFRAGDEARSYALMRVPLRRLTGEAVITALPRVQAQRPDIVALLAQTFLNHFAEALQELQAGRHPGQVAPKALYILRWLVEDELSAEQQAQSTTELLAALQDAQDVLRAEQLAHQATLREVEKYETRLEKLLAQFTRAEEQTQERVDALQRRHTQHLDRQGTQHQLHLLREQQAHGRTRESLNGRIAELELERSRLKDDLQAQVEKQTRDLRLQLVRERVDADQRRTLLQRQLREQHEQIDDLIRKLEALRQQPPAPALDVAQLEDALILHYEGCGQTPVDRLLGLFGAYRAFLNGQPDERLTRASNIAALNGRAPSGLLLLGMERLLEDGANLPLERYLRSRVFQQEARLHGLIENLTSPRLEVPS